MSPQRSAGRRNQRLERARAAGYLNAPREHDALKREYALWCWKLRLPVVWFERKSPRSRFGRVVLDLLTTPHELTANGMAELSHLAGALGIAGDAAISTGEGVWENVPVARLEELARSVLRIVTRHGSYEVRKRTPPAAVVKMFDAIRERARLRKSA